MNVCSLGAVARRTMAVDALKRRSNEGTREVVE